MKKGRLEAFSDGVLAIIITIMVLELRAPHGDDWAALRESIPSLLTYALSFIYLGIYWNNHHMLHAAERVNGYALALPLAFVHAWVSIAIYVAVALLWLVPDRRIETRVGA